VQPELTASARREFLIREALASSVIAAFAHASVYDPDATDAERVAVRGNLKLALRSTVDAYRTRTPDDDEHLATIQGIADYLSENHPCALRGGRFRLGIAQKALNLFLKYLWCLGEIERPPHCPFDSVVLAKISPMAEGGPFTPWTKMDNSTEYRRYVASARATAGGKPLPDWELEVFAEAKH
jgi:hypothetical protein